MMAIGLVRVKGGSGSGNFGHAGRPGKIGGSAPKGSSNGNPHKTVKAKYHRLEDMPAYQQYGDDEKYGIGYNAGGDTNQDVYLKAIIHDQGFDGLPEVLDTGDIDRYVAAGETELWRGVSAGGPIPGESDLERYARYDAKNYGPDIERATALVQQFMNGDMFVGKGVYGNGVYAGVDWGTAADYAWYGGVTMRMTLKKGAKVIEIEDVIKGIKAQGRTPGTEDNGRWAASRGYDAIHITARGYDREHQWIILNRTAVRVDKRIYPVED